LGLRVELRGGEAMSLKPYPVHDIFCPPGLKFDEASDCIWCLSLAKARHHERLRIAAMVLDTDKVGAS
jgi:hypothetical protein